MVQTERAMMMDEMVLKRPMVVATDKTSYKEVHEQSPQLQNQVLCSDAKWHWYRISCKRFRSSRVQYLTPYLASGETTISSTSKLWLSRHCMTDMKAQ